MSSTFSAEQDQLKQVARSFFERQSSEADVRRLIASESGFDPRAWRQMAEQLGVQGLTIPERFGGSGYSFLELGLVLEESGRALLCLPLFSTSVLSTSALLSSNDENANADFLPAIAAGTTRAALAIAESASTIDGIGDIAATAHQRDGDWYLHGTKTLVVDGKDADLVLVFAQAAEGLSLFAIEDLAAVKRITLPTLDATRRLASLEFLDVRARLIGVAGDGDRVLADVLVHAAIGLAVEAVGGAQWCLDAAVSYAKTREQFGRPIGSNQAIKHKCADMLLSVEASRSAAYHGLWSISTGVDDREIAAALAKAFATEGFFTTAAECLQIHGGIGFTWEHPSHFYLKRAKASQLLFGTPEHHRKLLAIKANL